MTPAAASGAAPRPPALAAHGDCIIVGRNADLILAEHRPLKLFVYADLESRLRRCRERSSDDERFTLRELERKLRAGGPAPGPAPRPCSPTCPGGAERGITCA